MRFSRAALELALISLAFNMLSSLAFATCPFKWPGNTLDVKGQMHQATPHYDYPCVTIGVGIQAMIKMGTCEWCHGISSQIAFAFDRALSLNCSPPLTGIAFDRHSIVPLLHYFKNHKTKLIQYDAILKNKGIVEGTIQYFVPPELYRSVPGKFCLSPLTCANESACPFTPDAVADVVLFDYFIGNADRPGNCFNRQGWPLMLDQGAGEFFKIVPSYRDHPIRKVAMQVLIDEHRQDKHICDAKNRVWGEIKQNVLHKLWDTLRKTSIANDTRTTLGMLLASKEQQHVATHILTMRIKGLATYWETTCV
jgi:hypothetical protein